jgi:hypothetical protein
MRVNLAITDRCNRACKNCCCGIPKIKNHWDISFPELEDAAKTIKGVDVIRLTGGEPSTHPLFTEISSMVRDMFGCKFLEIETNGYLFPKDMEVFEKFDLVEVTNYTEPTFATNKSLIEMVLKNKRLIGKVHIGDPVVHFPIDRRSPGKTCERGNLTMVSLYKGRIYPCAMGWGIDDPVSVALSPNWKEELKKLKLPCDRCFLAGT